MAEAARPESSLVEVEQNISAVRKSHDALKAVRDAVDQHLSEIERRQGELARTITELETQSRQRDQRVKELGSGRDKLKASIKQQQKILAGHLRSAYAVGRNDWLKLSLNQESPSRLARVLAYFGYLNTGRAILIQQWTDNLVLLERTEHELSEEMGQRDEIRQRIKREQSALLESGRARRLLLAGWDEELRSQDASLARLEEDQRYLRALIESVATDSSPSQRRESALTPSSQEKKQCPPAGILLAGFGTQRMRGRWDGILIGGKEGSPVRAVESGRVAFADWFRGYGLLTIIDHGDGVMSLYAFNQSLHKAKGDVVAAGDQIATLGASGGRNRPGLYFGIRKQGQPADPVAWCAGRQ